MKGPLRQALWTTGGVGALLAVQAALASGRGPEAARAGLMLATLSVQLLLLLFWGIGIARLPRWIRVGLLVSLVVPLAYAAVLLLDARARGTP